MRLTAAVDRAALSTVIESEHDGVGRFRGFPGEIFADRYVRVRRNAYGFRGPIFSAIRSFRRALAVSLGPPGGAESPYEIRFGRRDSSFRFEFKLCKNVFFFVFFFSPLNRYLFFSSAIVYARLPKSNTPPEARTDRSTTFGAAGVRLVQRVVVCNTCESITFTIIETAVN